MNRFVVRCLVLSTLSLAGCALLAPITGTPTTQKVQQPARESGALTINLSAFEPKIKISSYQAQALPVSTVAGARVTVTGDFIFDPLTTTVPVNNGRANAEIANIPIGANRILTVEGLDSTGAAVPGAVLRAVVTIKPGSNQASVTWESTPAGSVFHALHQADRQTGRALSATVSAEKVQELVASVTSTFGVAHPSLVKAEAIASQIRASNGQVPPATHSFAVAPAYVDLMVRGLPSGKTITAQITDPASKVFVNVANGRYRIEPITPGSWVLVLNSADYGRKTADLTLYEGASASVEVDYAGSEAIGIDFGDEATQSAPQPNPLPSVAPTPTPAPLPTPTPTPLPPPPGGEGFFNLLIRFDQ